MKALTLAAALVFLGSSQAEACKMTRFGSQRADTADVMEYLGKDSGVAFSYEIEAIRYPQDASVALDLVERASGARQTRLFFVNRGADCQGTVQELAR